MKKAFYMVRLGHSRVTFVGLVQKSRTNIDKMKNNPVYTTPLPSLEAVSDAADRLGQALQDYGFSRSRLDKQERDLAFKELKALRTDLGGYVQSVSAGDLEQITSAGFETDHVREPLGLLAPPSNVRAVPAGYPGEAELRFGGVRGRIAYQVFICEGDPDVEANWKLYATTSKVVLKVVGLERFRTYYLRVVTLGAAGASVVSDLAKVTAA